MSFVGSAFGARRKAYPAVATLKAEIADLAADRRGDGAAVASGAAGRWQSVKDDVCVNAETW